MKPDYRRFRVVDGHAHGSIDGHDTEHPDLDDAPDSTELHDLAEEMRQR